MWKRKRDKRSGHDEPDLATELERLNADNERLISEFAGMQRHFSGLARSVWRLQEEERRRLARELHDSVGQNLIALRQRVERLPVSEDRDHALVLTDRVLEDVRELSRLLRPPMLDYLGLAAALQWLGRQFRETGELEVTVDVTPLEEISLAEDAEILLFRVVQEALTNTLRHAQARSVQIQATRLGDRVEVCVQDDGRGFDPAELDADPERLGVGLTGMRDRVRLFGGDLAIRSRRSGGTTVQVGINSGRREAGADS